MHFLVFPIVATLLLWILHGWASSCFPWLGRHKRWLAAVLGALLVVEVVARRIELRWHVGGTFQTVCVVIVMTLVVAAAPIGAMRVSSYLLSRLRRRPSKVAEAPQTMTRRQVVEATGGVALLGVTGSMMGWGIVRGRTAFELCEIPVHIPGLPRTLDGYVIVQVSDIHTGIHLGERELDEGFELVRRARPDLIVATGDLVDSDTAFAPLVARKLADLAARDGVFACLGNHDYYAGADVVEQTLRAAGVTPLVNEGRLVRVGDGGGFALLGVDDQWSYRYERSGPLLAQAATGVPEQTPRILLSHQPPTVDRWAGQVALQLSGHTHGGQINPGGLRPADLFYKYIAGRYVVGQTTLYVNRGFGTVGPPARLWAPPEITRIVLVA